MVSSFTDRAKKSMAEALIDVEVAYATPEQQMIVALKMPEGTDSRTSHKRIRLVEPLP